MTRKACKRVIRRQLAPTLIALHLNPEVCLQERASVAAFRGGWAEGAHYNVLADCRDMLMLAASERKDQSALAACEMAKIALQNIRDRRERTTKFGATGDEIRALDLLCDASEDFWRRQPGGLFVDAEAALQRARDQHADYARMGEAA